MDSIKARVKRGWRILTHGYKLLFATADIIRLQVRQDPSGIIMILNESEDFDTVSFDLVSVWSDEGKSVEFASTADSDEGEWDNGRASPAAKVFSCANWRCVMVVECLVGKRVNMAGGAVGDERSVHRSTVDFQDKLDKLTFFAHSTLMEYGVEEKSVTEL